MPPAAPDAGPHDPRRDIPRTDVLLADPALKDAARRLGEGPVRTAVRTAQEAARRGEITPGEVRTTVLSTLPPGAASLRPVLNATGVVLHTNLGRAPLSEAAVAAMVAAGGYTDVELDLTTGRRSRRAQALLDALVEAVGPAQAAHVTGNGAAAVLLAVTALAGGGEVLVSRGELVEIGDGFRLPELLTSTGVRLHEVGTTNRTHLADYAAAVGPDTRAIVKIHPSNFTMHGFTSSVAVADLAGLGLPVIHDLGSGLLRPEPLLPDEPDATTSLAQGATVVTCSGDKLFGGPQAGLVLGRASAVERIRRHPLARAVRPDKTTLAGLEATLTGPVPPVWEALYADPHALRHRTLQLAASLGRPAEDVVPVSGRVGGGSAPGVELAGCALALPVAVAHALRAGNPPVVARVEHDRCLVDLRCIPSTSDEELATAIRTALA